MTLASVTMQSRHRPVKVNRFWYIDSADQGIVWKYVVAFAIFHILTGRALYFALSRQLHPYTVIFGERMMKNGLSERNSRGSQTALFYGWFASLGITAGGHRLWSHRAYKARLPARILLMIAHTAAGQVRDKMIKGQRDSPSVFAVQPREVGTRPSSASSAPGLRR